MTQENGTQGLDLELKLGKWQRLNNTQESVTPFHEQPVPSQDPCSLLRVLLYSTAFVGRVGLPTHSLHFLNYFNFHVTIIISDFPNLN